MRQMFNARLASGASLCAPQTRRVNHLALMRRPRSLSGRMEGVGGWDDTAVVCGGRVGLSVSCCAWIGSFVVSCLFDCSTVKCLSSGRSRRDGRSVLYGGILFTVRAMDRQGLWGWGNRAAKARDGRSVLYGGILFTVRGVDRQGLWGWGNRAAKARGGLVSPCAAGRPGCRVIQG